MQLKAIQNSSELEQMAGEWNEFLNCCSASHVPFLRHEYLHTWWRTLGGGEWSHGELFTVVAYQETGGLAGIAPLFFSENRDGEQALLLLGSIEISDYLDFIVQTPDAPAFLDALLNFLEEDLAPGWQVLDLYNIPEESPSLPALKAAAESRGWTYTQERLQPCPYIPLPGDWDAYLAGIDKKQRHEIRRKMRRAEDSGLNMRWYIAEDGSQLDAEIEDFISLMMQDPSKKDFLTEAMHTQIIASARAAFEQNWLQLAFLEVDGQKAAGYLNFDFAGHIWVYNSGWSFDFRDISPGWVLLGYLIRWANENERESLDFMRGDESYKYRFGGIDRFVTRATVRPPGR